MNNFQIFGRSGWFSAKTLWVIPTRRDAVGATLFSM